jgi:hypothetical protein
MCRVRVNNNVSRTENIKIHMFVNDASCGLENSSRHSSASIFMVLGLLDSEEGGITFLRSVSNFVMRRSKHIRRLQSSARNVRPKYIYVN